MAEAIVFLLSFVSLTVALSALQTPEFDLLIFKNIQNCSLWVIVLLRN